MFKTFSVAILAATAMAAQEFTYRYQGKNYFSWSAKHKWERMYDELADVIEESLEYHYDSMPELFHQKSNKTTCNPNDELPTQNLSDVVENATGRRKKLLHTKGVVGAVEWVSNGAHDYTGLFQGAEYGFVRLSDAGFLLQDFDENEIFSPSVAMKWFVDGQKSRNLLTQVAFDGIDDDYFFAEDITTHARRPENACLIDTLELKFADASQFPFQTGTGHLASVTQDGEDIEAADALFPYQVILLPNRNEFPRPVERMDFLEYFTEWYVPNEDATGEIQPVKLFDVMALHNPTSDEELIGEIVLTSPLVRSMFGDERLFFQHETINRDLSKLNQQGDEGKDRKEQWLEMLEIHPKKTDADSWQTSGREVTLMDPNQEAMDIIEDGVREFGCPFAWLLE